MNDLLLVIAIITFVAVVVVASKSKGKKKGAEEVPQGLQVFDENGNVTLDITDRLTRIIGAVDLLADEGAVVVNDPNRIFFYVINTEPTTEMWPVEVKQEGNVLKWKYQSPYLAGSVIDYRPHSNSGRLIYGTY